METTNDHVHNKTILISLEPTKISWEPSKDSEQPGHLDVSGKGISFVLN